MQLSRRYFLSAAARTAFSEIPVAAVLMRESQGEFEDEFGRGGAEFVRRV